MALEGLPTLDLPPDEDAPEPPNSATPEDLAAHPGLARLLRNLGGLLGGDGLSPPLQKELRQAEALLGRARGPWLRLELLWRLLEELIREPRDVEPAVLQSLEQELSLARLRRGRPELAPSPKPQPPAPGSRLLPALRLRLREKREQLLGFLLGTAPNPAPKTPQIPPQNPQNPPQNPQNPQNPQISPQNLRALLGRERRRLQRERLRGRRLREQLRELGWRYPQVLSRCLSLLGHAHSLQELQAHLDEGRGRYLLARGGAMLLKSRLEELRILLDTYPAPKIEAHQRIRAGLSERRRAADAEVAALEAELSSLRGLGPEFRELALELGRIRRESARKGWALHQLRPPPP